MYGTVFSRSTHAPLPGAKVSVEAGGDMVGQCYTGSDGTYEIPFYFDKTDGKYGRVRADYGSYYNSDSQEFDIKSGASKILIDLEIDI